METTSLWSMKDGGRKRKMIIDINFCHKDLNMGGNRGLGLVTWQILWTVTGWAVQQIILRFEKHLHSLLLCRAGVPFLCVTPQLKWNLFPWLLWSAALAQAGSYLFRGGRPHNPASTNCSITYCGSSDVRVQPFSRSWSWRWSGHICWSTGAGGSQEQVWTW